MFVQIDFFIHCLNIFLNQCENTKVHYWNAQMKAIVLEMIVEERRQNENSGISSGITRVSPIARCDFIITNKRLSSQCIT